MNTIDCNANPYVPNGWKVEEHIRSGEFRWNSDEVELYLCDEQKSGYIDGDELRTELADKSVLNACVLDYLLDKPQLIPEEWKDKSMFFWGTIYRRWDNHLCVRYLYWSDDRWYWDSYWLGNSWFDDSPTVLFGK